VAEVWGGRAQQEEAVEEQWSELQQAAALSVEEVQAEEVELS
jgi:hypothetical protein